MKKTIAFLTVMVMMVSLTFAKVNAQGSLSVDAPSAILVEKITGSVLYEKDADKVMKPASVTKVMTLLLIFEAIENGQFTYDDVVTASANATSMGGSQVYLKEGEQMTVDEMLKCIVISSANDACVAMAEFVCGSVEQFVVEMNEKASDLGMENTNFENCTGLDSDKHYTTARDISKMSRELLKYEKIKDYTTVWMDSIRNGEFGLTNTNKLIRFYNGATGLKTGYTSQSGYCISATALKDGMELIAVVMAGKSSDSRNTDAKAILNYGFANYSLYKPESLSLEPVKVIKGKDKTVMPKINGTTEALVEKSNLKNIKYVVDVCRDVMAPVETGQKLGELKLVSGERVITKIDIVSSSSVQKAGVFEFFLELVKHFLSF